MANGSRGAQLFEKLLTATKNGKLNGDYWKSTISPLLVNATSWRELYHGISPPESPGIYIWISRRDIDGQNRSVPRKVGETGWDSRKKWPSRGTLYKRMTRYVRGPNGGYPKAQCQLAYDYQRIILDSTGSPSNAKYMAYRDEILNLGFDSFPQEIHEWYRQNYRQSGRARLNGAVDFALHGGTGLANIAVFLIAASAERREDLEPVEKALRNAADQYNALHNLPKTINS